MGQAYCRRLVVFGILGTVIGLCAEARAQAPCLLALCRAADMVQGRPSAKLVDFDAPSSAMSPLWRSLHWVGRRLSSRGGAERGLVKFLPLPEWGPSLTLEGGTVFDVDTERLGRMFGIDGGAIERLGYDFGDAHLGLEIGRARSYQLLIRGGVSMLQSRRSTLQEPVGGWGACGAQLNSTASTQFGASARVSVVIYL